MSDSSIKNFKEIYSKSSGKKGTKTELNEIVKHWDLKTAEGLEKSLLNAIRPQVVNVANSLRDGFEKSFRQQANGDMLKKDSRHERDILFLSTFTNILNLWTTENCKVRTELSQAKQQEIIDIFDSAFKSTYHFLKRAQEELIAKATNFTPEMHKVIGVVNSSVSEWMAKDDFYEFIKSAKDENELYVLIRQKLAGIDKTNMDLQTKRFVELLQQELERLTDCIIKAEGQAKEITGKDSSPFARLQATRNSLQQLKISTEAMNSNSISSSASSSSISSSSLSSSSSSNLISSPSTSSRRLSGSSSKLDMNKSLADQYVKKITAENEKISALIVAINTKLTGFNEGNNDGLPTAVVKLVKAQLELLFDMAQDYISEAEKIILAMGLDVLAPMAWLELIKNKLGDLDLNDDTDAHVQQVLSEKKAQAEVAITRAETQLFEFQTMIAGKKLPEILTILQQAIANLDTIENLQEKLHCQSLFAVENSKYIQLKAQAEELFNNFDITQLDVAPQHAVAAYGCAIGNDMQGLEPLVDEHYKILLGQKQAAIQACIDTAKGIVTEHLMSIKEQKPTDRLLAVNNKITEVNADDIIDKVTKTHQLVLLQQEQGALQISIFAAEKLYAENTFVFSSYKHDPLQCSWQFDETVFNAELQAANNSIDNIDADPVTKEQYRVLLQQAEETLPVLTANVTALLNANEYSAALPNLADRLAMFDTAKVGLTGEDEENKHVIYLLTQAHKVLESKIKQVEQFLNLFNNVRDQTLALNVLNSSLLLEYSKLRLQKMVEPKVEAVISSLPQASSSSLSEVGSPLVSLELESTKRIEYSRQLGQEAKEEKKPKKPRKPENLKKPINGVQVLPLAMPQDEEKKEKKVV